MYRASLILERYYGVNFTTAMPDANYAVAGSAAGPYTNNLPLYFGQDSDDTRSTTEFRFSCIYNNASSVNLDDSPNVNIVVFR